MGRSFFFLIFFLVLTLLVEKLLVSTRLCLLLHIQVGLGLFVLFILLFHDLARVNLKFLLVRLVRLRWYEALRWHVENLKHRVEVQMVEVQRLQNNLADDEIDKLFFQLDFFEEANEIFLTDCPFAVPLFVQSCENVLVVVCHKLCDLNEHLFLLFLGHDFVILYEVVKAFDHCFFC